LGSKIEGETIGDTQIGIGCVHPGPGVVVIRQASTLAGVLGSTEQYEDLAHVGNRALTARTLELVVGRFHPSLVLLPELVVRGHGVWIPPGPEDLLEELAVLRFELFEDRHFLGGDECTNLLLEPFLVLLTQFVTGG
jgi:hypothetical protein